ncbi:hypothetical protein ACLTEW_03590 [Gordonia lacunae]|uniref:Mce-associated membrane protein n=1 Tax=Gordonia lacunae TaxID=417102 RepID=A0A243Q4Y9_9ACTN|nr:hypothetical protein [Gordonia lacunae]OUC76475.1 hypothetical protein CA982_21540 [Gordonia lacunae]
MTTTADREPLPAQPTRRQRVRLRLVVAASVLLLVVAVIFGVAALRPDSDPTDDQRAEILSAAATAVEAVLTYSPDDPPGRPRATDALLTDPLRLDYRNRGADVVVPGVRASALSVRGEVVGAGLHEAGSDRARVLVFVNEVVGRTADEKSTDVRQSVGGKPAATPTARWALMRKVDGNWLLSDLQPVGDVTR